MNARRMVLPLAGLLLIGIFDVPDQQSAAERKKFEEIKGKAEKGDAHAQFHIGDFYRKGKGAPRDAREAVKWYRKAADQGYAIAQYSLGLCYRNGEGVPQDHAEAAKWYLRAAEQGLAEAQHELGHYYRDGKGVSQDYAEAVKWYRKAADQGYAWAQYNLAVCYAKGDGVLQDQAETAKWCRRAAEQGFALAQYQLGNHYREGRGVRQDYGEAVNWYRKAADQGNAVAQHDLGICYAKGEGVPQDDVEAYKWILLAVAQQSFVPAQETMTTLERELTDEQRAEGQKRASTFKPSGVTSLEAEQSADYDKSQLADLVNKANHGDAKAQNELGETFYAGNDKLGVVKNPVEAVEWFLRAAAQNYAPAQSNLGRCYERGEGVAKYEVEAYKWDLLAAGQGDDKVKRNASMMELMLSKEELTEGKRRADDWLERRKKSPDSNR